MRWHYGNRRVIDRDPRLEEFCWQGDLIFYDIWQEKRGLLDSLDKCGQELRQRYKGLRDSIRKFPFRKPTVIREVVPDLYTIDSRFLINHIDHVFYQWRISPFACRLSFEEFCKTLLPYRPV